MITGVKLSKGHLLSRDITGMKSEYTKWFKMKVRWLGIYISISLQLISYLQLHRTHTKEVEIASLGD